MDAISKVLLEVLSPTCLILLFVVIWQFREMHQKDIQHYDMFKILNNHTDAINRFMGVLEGQRGVVP